MNLHMVSRTAERPHTAGLFGSRGANRADLSIAARSDACLLLTGPPRLTRDLAYRVHKVSGWRTGPFLVVDCTASEAELVHDLFATLADAPVTPGTSPYVRATQEGSVLLQEVGRLSATVQRRLADLLVDLRGKGSGRNLRRRIMASTSFPLMDAVRTGTFDDRLYYRLNVIQLDCRE